MSMRRRHNNNITKTLKDYAVPLVALFLIIILAFSVFSWWNNDNSDQTNLSENMTWANLEFNSDDTEVYIEYSWWDRKLVENNTSLYKWEKVIVKNGSVSIDFPILAKVNLDKMWELEYREDGSLYLDSSSLWLESKTNLKVNLRYWTVEVDEWWVINLNQNEVQSTFYSLDWLVEVSNLAWKSSLLQKWQELSILVADASSDDIDLSSLKQDFSDYFKASDWYIRNGWDFYLNNSWDEESSTGSTQNKTILWAINNYISFDNLTDESQVTTDVLNISWKYNSDMISKISLNWIDAILDIDNKTFVFKDVSLNSSVNDLVFKVYDLDDEILSKVVYTIYTSLSSSSSSSNFWTVKTFDIDASKFVFSEPSTTWTYSTYESQVTIKWSVPAWIVSSITVNGYKLWSFNWTTWRYHAWADYNTLKDWTNIYEVKYFDSNWKVIYENYFTIIKKTSSTTNNTYSSEAIVE